MTDMYIIQKLGQTFSDTSRTELTLVPYRLSLYCPASMNKWLAMSCSIFSRESTKW